MHIEDPDNPNETKTQKSGTVHEIAKAFLKLGLISFGGPIAHLGYFRTEFVERRKWLSDRAYADLIALCQFLPGPASSQTGIALGAMRAGWGGALAAWFGFTIPSAILMILAAYAVRHMAGDQLAWLNGLKIVAVAIVAHAVWGMAKSLCPDVRRATLAVIVTVAALAWPTGVGQLTLMALAALTGLLVLAPEGTAHAEPLSGGPGRRNAVLLWIAFFALLFGLPVMRSSIASHALNVFDSFYRAGSLVFGGGHVVLPLLHAEVVPTGWITQEAFLAGYGLAQTLPGPLFTFAAFLGAVQIPSPNGAVGGFLALAGIFVPAFLLVLGAVPFWDAIRSNPVARRALNGVNAGVVGILLAALYHPIWSTAIQAPRDFSLALLSFALLAFWKAPPWIVVLFAGIGGAILHAM